jgi:hypothetical protein
MVQQPPAVPLWTAVHCRLCARTTYALDGAPEPDAAFHELCTTCELQAQEEILAAQVPLHLQLPMRDGPPSHAQ